MPDKLTPKDHGESVALFRAQVLGPVLCGDLEGGTLAAALRALSLQRVRPPGSTVTRTFAVPTLQRWYYRFRRQGIEGLRPATRKTGHAQALTQSMRQLIVAIRREYPSASVPLILRTLEEEGRIPRGTVKASAIRRLLADHGLDRRTLARSGKRERRRWQTDRPGRLWHADVCHGPSLVDGKTTKPLRIHGLLDDASRYVVALAAHHTEREADMLDVLVQACRVHGKPEGLYLDNGSTYRGEVLATACGRLGIALIHARPYDPQARGKMERFWRTLRESCLDFLGTRSTLHEVQVRLLAFLDTHYHRAPHAGLMGRTPAKVWATRVPAPLSEAKLAQALTIRARRLVRNDGTISVGGIDWEAEHGFLAGRTVVIARTLAQPQVAPWVELDGQRLLLHPVDPEANAHRGRKYRAKRGLDAIDFDPNHIRIQRMLGRSKGGGR